MSYDFFKLPVRAMTREKVTIENMTRPELIDVLDSRGFALDDITGSGANGYITKSDLIKLVRDGD